MTEQPVRRIVTSPPGLNLRVPAWAIPSHGSHAAALRLLAMGTTGVDDPERIGLCDARVAAVGRTAGAVEPDDAEFCGAPLFAAHLAAKVVAATWKDDTDAAQDGRLHELIDGLIGQLWPAADEAWPPSQASLHAASLLRRHLAAFHTQGMYTHPGLTDLARAASAQKQTYPVAVYHLVRTVIGHTAGAEYRLPVVVDCLAELTA
ncbi:hypothetical protein R8Z50_15045 [Longispora sp. K20-0274]|uniref:hypothetical protein n=1 Tax=Longispora sp. K20-0274 TaxID=3088255 RepID=UPI003999548C